MAKRQQTPEEEVQVLMGDDVDGAQVDLPPPGHERDEALKKRADDLDEAAEKRANTVEKYPMDSDAFKPVREIQDIFEQHNYLEVSDTRPGYAYVWACCHPLSQDVWKKKADGWQVVQGDDPEAREHKRAEDTTRRIGDAILMRISMERKIALDKRAADRQRAHEMSVVAEVEQLGHRYRDSGLIVHTSPDAKLRSGRNVMDVARSGAVHRQAMEGVDRMIRNGSVPGMPGPGGNR